MKPKHDCILTVDFGSTFTKLTAINMTYTPQIIGAAKAFTTIETDIRDGLNTALADLQAQTGLLFLEHYTHKLASSSAGGGLKMVAVGLVPALTAKAALLAACSAGAKVVKTYAYELSAIEQQEIYDINPDLVLLSGGTDGGNKEVILHNATLLAGIDRGFSVIVAGNKSVATNVAETLRNSGKDAVICGNVMPTFNKLDIMPAKDAIRGLFMEKIIEAKGLTQAASFMTAPIIPTPLAVFEAAQLLSEDLGSIMAVDVGGATTDVYSMADGAPSLPNVVQKGLPEPYAKRSVEGDLGMRYSLEALMDAARDGGKLPDNFSENSFSENICEMHSKHGINNSVAIASDIQAGVRSQCTFDIRVDAQSQYTCDILASFLAKCANDPSFLPSPGSQFSQLDQALCGIAVDIATTRHTGHLETSFTPFGETYYQQGKDLSNVKYVIGIGGPIIYSPDARTILQNAIASPSSQEILKPRSPKFLLDKSYIFAAAGLISKVNKGIALQLMQNELTEV